MKRLFVALVATLSLLASLAITPAGAVGTSDVYVLHGIPGVAVDVYVNGDLTLPAFEPEEITNALPLAAGNYRIEIFAAVSSPAATSAARTDSAVIDVTPAVPGGESVSVIAHLDASGAPTLSAFVNDLSDTADADTGRVTIRHAAAAPAVDIVAAGAAVAPLTNIVNGAEAKTDLPAGNYPTGIAATGTTAVLFDAPVTVVGGTNVIVYAIGSLAGETFGLISQSFDGIAPPPTSAVSVVHGIPGVTVDVYAGGELLLPGFAPKTVAGPLDLPEGDYRIEIFAATSSPAATSAARTDSAVIDATKAVPGGADLDLVAHLDASGAPTLTAFVNDVSVISPSTYGRVTVRHTAAAPKVDIVAGGAAVAPLSGISNGEQKIAELPAGDYPTGIAAAGTTAVLFDAPVSLVPGRAVTVYAIGSLAGETFDLIVQTESGLQLADRYKGTSGNQASIARLYLAVLGRNPDDGGFDYWVGQVQSGNSILELIGFFEISEEFQVRFPNVDTNEEFLDLTYGHVFGRSPDPEGRAYWLALLNGGSLDRHEMLLYFAESQEFKNNTGTN